MITAAKKSGNRGMAIGQKPEAGNPNRSSGRGGTGAKTARSLAFELWREWVELTARPDDEPDKKVIDRLTAAVKSSRKSSIKGVAQLASYARPEGDRDDVKRLQRVLSSKLKREEAELLAGGSGSPILYSPGSNRISHDTLAELMASPSTIDWSNDDVDAANKLSWMEKETVESLVRTARAVSGVEELFPSEVLRDGRKKVKKEDRRQSSPKQDNNSGYDRGAISAKKLSGELIQYDELAYEKILDGEDESSVIAFHSLAPAGYWDDVVKETQDGTSPRDAYEKLESKYPGFDPLSDNREGGDK